MTKRLFAELLIAGILVIPLLYLLASWNSIPDIIPVHFGLNGEADRWDQKTMLLYFLPFILILQYGLLVLLPLVDPKKKISGMGRKYFSLRIMLSSALCSILLIYIKSLSDPALSFMQMLFPMLSVILVVTGNLVQSLKPNFVLGIRTPWTLSCNSNWQQTHRFAARVYITGGIILLILSVSLEINLLHSYFFVSLLLLLISPVIYSFLIRQNKSNKQNKS